MSKRTRQQAILEIVSQRRVQSQAILAEELKEQGFEVTQATLSRDIAELELVKSKDGYLRPEDASGAVAVPDPTGTLRRLVLKVDIAGNLVIIKSPPGSAQQVAIVIEDDSYEGLVGTIGGDDTSLMIMSTPQHAEGLKKYLMDILE